MNNYLTIKTTISDIESKEDRNFNPYFKLTAVWGAYSQTLYAFSYSLTSATLKTLSENPEKFINQLVLITYQEQDNRDSGGTFFKVKEIELV